MNVYLERGKAPRLLTPDGVEFAATLKADDPVAMPMIVVSNCVSLQLSKLDRLVDNHGNIAG